MTNIKQDFLAFVGRIIFSLIFIGAGFEKIVNFSQTATALTQKGMEMGELWLIAAIILELGGGLLIFLGIWTRLGALMILVFVIPVTYFFHSFWAMEPEVMVNQMHHFMKNLSILGGCLYILAFGSGKWAIDSLWKKRNHDNE